MENLQTRYENALKRALKAAHKAMETGVPEKFLVTVSRGPRGNFSDFRVPRGPSETHDEIFVAYGGKNPVILVRMWGTIIAWIDPVNRNVTFNTTDPYGERWQVPTTKDRINWILSVIRPGSRVSRKSFVWYLDDEEFVEHMEYSFAPAQETAR